MSRISMATAALVFVAAIGLLVPGLGMADNIPTHGAVIHYDACTTTGVPPDAHPPYVKHPPGGIVLCAGGDLAVAPIPDAVDSPDPWHEEAEICNTTVFACGFDLMLGSNLGFKPARFFRVATLAPGKCVLWDTHEDEAAAPACGADLGCTPNLMVISGKFGNCTDLDVSYSVTENPSEPDSIPDEAEEILKGDLSPDAIIILPQSPVPALSGWGIGLFLLLTSIGGAFIARRRRA